MTRIHVRPPVLTVTPLLVSRLARVAGLTVVPGWHVEAAAKADAPVVPIFVRVRAWSNDAKGAGRLLWGSASTSWSTASPPQVVPAAPATPSTALLWWDPLWLRGSRDYGWYHRWECLQWGLKPWGGDRCRCGCSRVLWSLEDGAHLVRQLGDAVHLRCRRLCCQAGCGLLLAGHEGAQT